MASPHIVSLNVSLAKEVNWRGQLVKTGIFKEPTQQRLFVHKMGIEYDEQADLSVHGGTDKAVYSYAMEHYPYWNELLSKKVSMGGFGENITSYGLDENNICLGDQIRMGSCVLEATQPREPCFKLAMKFADPSILKKFIASKRFGIYFKVLKEGHVEVNDTIEVIFKDKMNIKIFDIASTYYDKERKEVTLNRLLSHEKLTTNWRTVFSNFLDQAKFKK